MANGNKLIGKGMAQLTAATDNIQKGIDANDAKAQKNCEKILELKQENTLLTSANIKASTIIKNFKKNILGE